MISIYNNKKRLILYLSYIIFIINLFSIYGWKYEGGTNIKLINYTIAYLSDKLIIPFNHYYTYKFNINEVIEPSWYKEILFDSIRATFISITFIIILSSIILSKSIEKYKRTNRLQYTVAFLLIIGFFCVLYEFIFVDTILGYHHLLGAYILLISIIINAIAFIIQ